MLLPDFSNAELVKQLYMQDVTKRRIDTIHNLKTNFILKDLLVLNHLEAMNKVSCNWSTTYLYGYSCLVSMTTGGGKSLITQTIAYQEIGLTIVIVPTVSLMMDQYDNAKKNNKVQ